SGIIVVGDRLRYSHVLGGTDKTAVEFVADNHVFNDWMYSPVRIYIGNVGCHTGVIGIIVHKIFVWGIGDLAGRAGGSVQVVIKVPYDDHSFSAKIRSVKTGF